jgi:hypothetical protein
MPDEKSLAKHQIQFNSTVGQMHHTVGDKKKLKKPIEHQAS